MKKIADSVPSVSNFSCFNKKFSLKLLERRTACDSSNHSALDHCEKYRNFT